MPIFALRCLGVWAYFESVITKTMCMRQKLLIVPFIGIDPVRFGMTTREVALLLGPPEELLIDSSNGELREFRRGNALQLLYKNKGEHLAEIGLDAAIDELYFENIAVFKGDPFQIAQALCSMDENPHEYEGCVLLLNLGIALRGFEEGSIVPRTITVFESLRWGELKTGVKPYQSYKV